MSNTHRSFDKVAFVAGAASGIGRVTAIALQPRVGASLS